MPFLGAFSNLDLFSVGIASAATGILGFVVYFNNRKSITNTTFFLFCLSTVTWGIINYLNSRFASPIVVLWMLRLVMFSAVWVAFFLHQLFFVFPSDKAQFSPRYKYWLIPVVAITALVTLTPLVFSRIINVFQAGEVAKVAIGPGIILFGLVAIGLVAHAMVLLIRKMRKAQGQERRGIIFIFIGTIIMFFCIIVFNFILPAFFNNQRFIPLGAVFTFPFAAFAGYAIIRHKLLDVKVVSTEILIFVLAIATLFEVVISNSVPLLILRSSIFLLVLGLGILLIRSVIREVKQREQLQILSEQLEGANQQLKVLDAARAEFISIASHQLRTPPATIKWYVGAILTGDFGVLAPDLKSALDRVNVTNNSQISLIDDLLNASRIERGKLEFFFEMGDLDALATLTVDQLIPQAGIKKLTLVYHKPLKPVPLVMLDKEKVRQVINNFIDNAIKYTKQGTIDVFVEQTATDVVVKVKDSGRGVPSDVAPTLFEKYKRGKDSASAATGLGLGLYVAKVIIEQNEGKIWVESEGDGKGSSFIFSIPIHSNLKETSTVDLVAEQSKPQPQ